MISLLWQDSVLSLLDQSVYPQEERWLTCTSLEETVQVLSSGAILVKDRRHRRGLRPVSGRPGCPGLAADPAI